MSGQTHLEKISKLYRTTQKFQVVQSLKVFQNGEDPVPQN